MSALSSEARAAMMRRLEHAAAGRSGIAILQRDEMQDLLTELRYLRANQDHRLERIEGFGSSPPELHYGPAGQVLLRTRVRVNGRERYAEQVVDEYVWSMYGPDFHEQLKAGLRHGLVEGIVEELGPLVEVLGGPRMYGNPFPSQPAPRKASGRNAAQSVPQLLPDPGRPSAPPGQS